MTGGKKHAAHGAGERRGEEGTEVDNNDSEPLTALPA